MHAHVPSLFITQSSKNNIAFFSYFWDLEDNLGITKLTVFPLNKMSVIQSHAAHTCSRVWNHTYKICIRLKIKKEKNDQTILIYYMHMSYVIVKFPYRICNFGEILINERQIHLSCSFLPGRSMVNNFDSCTYQSCIETQN